MRTYRVTVRGRFDGLGDEAKSKLLAEAADHDALNAQFTEAGTFTYDSALNAFSFRFVISNDDDDVQESAARAEMDGELRATEYLGARSYGYKALRLSCSSVDDMLSNTRRTK